MFTENITSSYRVRQFVRFHVLTAVSMKFRIVFWDVLPCKMIVDRRFRGMLPPGISSLMRGAARTSETSVDNYFTRHYIPEDNSELHVSYLFIWIYSGGGGMKFMKNLKGTQSINFGNLWAIQYMEPLSLDFSASAVLRKTSLRRNRQPSLRRDIW
jgi:hypothetical protein